MDFAFDIGAIDQRIQYAASFVLRYAVVLASAGAFAMALLELAKALFDWRTRFHAHEVTCWLLPAIKRKPAAGQPAKEAAQLKPDDKMKGAPVHPREAFAQLLQLCSSVSRSRARITVNELKSNRGRLRGWWLEPKPEYAPFAQDLEVMTSHFRDAIDIAINTPQEYKALFLFATSRAAKEDIAAWLGEPSDGEQGEPTELSATQRAEIFARLHHVARRRLDAFTLFTSTRWVNRQQLAANALGVAVLFSATVGTNVNIVEAIVISALGGILAPVAKDMVVALQQVRQR